MNQEYRFNLKLRRRGQPALDTHRVEFPSEEFDDDEQLAEAIAAEALMMIQADREYLDEKYDNYKLLEVDDGSADDD